MMRAILFAAALSTAVGLGVLWAKGGSEPLPRGTVDQAVNGSRIGDSGHGLNLKDESRRSLGSFALSRGRKLQLWSADTTDGKSCLFDDEGGVGAGSTCLAGGLFRLRKIAFSVNTQGGPERFSELYIPGVVAPGIRSVTLVKSDGSGLDLSLNKDGAFLFESPQADLDQGIYPSGFRLYGPNGTLVESLTLPSGP